MTLRLTVENFDRLPDGGPLCVDVPKGRGLDIGRDAHLDWTLPDPSRHVSGKHCEIRYRDGEYWLHDVSTNGTFVNGAEYRLDGPRVLHTGDRLAIGPYLVAVDIVGQAKAGLSAPSTASAAGFGADLWGPIGEAAAPEDRNAFRLQNGRPVAPDFLDTASRLPTPSPFASALGEGEDHDAWVSAPAPPAPIAPPPPVAAPSPRRPSGRPFSEESQSTQPPPTLPSGGPDTLARIAEAAGIPSSVLANRDPDELANEIGSALRVVATHLSQMLSSRAETKSLIRSSNRTMVRASENNPLKFSATPEDALAIMFGPPLKSYLNAVTTLERSFSDIENHQIFVFSAMQSALEELFADLSPAKIDASVDQSRGILGLVGSREAKLWDVFAERWRAKAKRSDGRLTEAFTLLFAEAYDRLNERR
jgi:type VI secretion system protein ImpI